MGWELLAELCMLKAVMTLILHFFLVALRLEVAFLLHFYTDKFVFPKFGLQMQLQSSSFLPCMAQLSPSQQTVELQVLTNPFRQPELLCL